MNGHEIMELARARVKRLEEIASELEEIKRLERDQLETLTSGASVVMGRDDWKEALKIVSRATEASNRIACAVAPRREHMRH